MGASDQQRRIKELRRNPTRAEQLLWAQLRRKRVADLRFRRQFPIGPYIVDFACLAARLIVEVDGEPHEGTSEYDERRSGWLQAQGFRVIRFRNEEVFSNLEGVVRTIEREVLAPVGRSGEQSKV